MHRPQPPPLPISLVQETGVGLQVIRFRSLTCRLRDRDPWNQYSIGLCPWSRTLCFFLHRDPETLFLLPGSLKVRIVPGFVTGGLLSSLLSFLWSPTFTRLWIGTSQRRLKETVRGQTQTIWTLLWTYFWQCFWCDYSKKIEKRWVKGIDRKCNPQPYS